VLRLVSSRLRKEALDRLVDINAMSVVTPFSAIIEKERYKSEGSRGRDQESVLKSLVCNVRAATSSVIDSRCRSFQN
jgi:hypothetical protein